MGKHGGDTRTAVLGHLDLATALLATATGTLRCAATDVDEIGGADPDLVGITRFAAEMVGGVYDRLVEYVSTHSDGDPLRSMLMAVRATAFQAEHTYEDMARLMANEAEWQEEQTDD